MAESKGTRSDDGVLEPTGLGYQLFMIPCLVLSMGLGSVVAGESNWTELLWVVGANIVLVAIWFFGFRRKHFRIDAWTIGPVIAFLVGLSGGVAIEVLGAATVRDVF